jgi:hypothetical protein
MGELANLEPLAVPTLRRTARDAWDAQPTIFPFLALDDHRPLSLDRTQALHRRLMCEASPVQLGQAVGVGLRDGKPLTALRLSLSARLVVEALTAPGGRELVIERARRALAETAAMARAI